jgi:CheY-like chemotaxis protein
VQETYDLAVVFDDLLANFDAAAGELIRLHNRLSTALRHIDLAYLRPSTLICRLAFDPKFVAATHIAERLSVAQTRHFRVLDLMTISAEQGKDLFEQQSAEAKWRRTPSEDLEADLQALRQILGTRLDGAERRSQNRTSLVMPVRFRGGPEDGLGLAKEVSTKGMYIESDVLPPRGSKLALELEPLKDTELRTIEVTVMHSLSHQDARQLGRVPGFGVSLALPAAQRRLFDSFLVTAVQGRPWPERSGRRYERFPIRLAAEWVHNGVAVASETVNVSRGGTLLRCKETVECGTELSLTLHSVDRSVHVDFAVRVVHCIDEKASEHTGVAAGLGLEFLESDEEISKKLGLVLGTHDLPAVHRALLVDDDRFFADLLGNTLRRSGYDVRYASTGERALKVLTEELFRFDVVVLDLHLPGMSGLALMDWLRKIDACSDIVVLLVTASELSEERQAEILALGADYILNKDVSTHRIVQTIDSLLTTA